jgi:predicted double-glycine peptidase
MSTQPSIPALTAGGTIRSRRHVRVIACFACAACTTLAILLCLPPLYDRALALLAGGRYLDQRGVIRQRDADDCGVATLAMMLATTSAAAEPPNTRTLDSLRAAIRARGHGLSMLELREIAAARGLDARGVRLAYADLPRLSMPVIAHFRGHYVVLDRVSGGTVTVRDPAVGRLQMTRASFERRWTGHVLLMAHRGSPMPR